MFKHCAWKSNKFYIRPNFELVTKLGNRWCYILKSSNTFKLATISRSLRSNFSQTHGNVLAGMASFLIKIVTGPTSGIAVTLKTGRREVSASNPGRACRPSHSEFSVVFSESRVNTGPWSQIIKSMLMSKRCF